MSKYLQLFLLICVSIQACSTSKSVEQGSNQLHHHQFSQLDSLQKFEPRPVVVFLHAPWCQFCRNMEKTTLREPEIVHLLNSRFYFVSFDGEQKEEVIMRGQSFQYKASGRASGTHELATALAAIDGILSYPTLIILNSNFEIVFQHGAHIDAQELKVILDAAYATDN